MPVHLSENTAASKPSRTPILLSLVFPGVGQFAQKRRVAGSVFFLITLAAFAMFVIESVHIISTFYHLMFGDVESPPSSLSMIMWFCITLVIYFVSLWDTKRAFNVALTSYSQSRVNEAIATAVPTASPPPLPSDVDPR